MNDEMLTTEDPFKGKYVIKTTELKDNSKEIMAVIIDPEHNVVCRRSFGSIRLLKKYIKEHGWYDKAILIIG